MGISLHIAEMTAVAMGHNTTRDLLILSNRETRQTNEAAAIGEKLANLEEKKDDIEMQLKLDPHNPELKASLAEVNIQMTHTNKDKKDADLKARLANLSKAALKTMNQAWSAVAEPFHKKKMESIAKEYKTFS